MTVAKRFISAVFACLMILFCPGCLTAQDTISHRTVFPAGLSIGYGVGPYSVRDEYISSEKYSGVLPAIELHWSRFHGEYVYYIGFEYESSSDIKNYTVSTDIYQFSLSQGFLYPLPNLSLLKKDVYAFLGPAAELYLFYNNQNIAVSGFDYAQSHAGLISAGLDSRFILPLGTKYQAEAGLNLSLLSLGLRMVDMEEEDVSPVKLLTLLAGSNMSLRLGIRYELFSPVSLKLGYKFHWARIRSWDPLLSAGDQAVVGMTFQF